MTTKPIYKSPAGENAIMGFYNTIIERWSVPYETLNIPTRHGDTFVIASGAKTAPPMILLHGSSTNSAMWSGDVGEYSRHYHVYAVDIIGEPGKSAPNRPSQQSHAYAEWLEDVLEVLHIDKAVFVGCSLGGWMAIKFATTAPQRVAKLVLLCPGGVAPVRPMMMLRIIALSFLGKRGLASINRLVYQDASIPAEVEEFGNLIMNHYNPRTAAQPIFTDEELARLTMPTLLVAGAQDCFFVSEKTAARLQKLLPQFTAVILPEAGHALLNTLPHIMPFLAAGNYISGLTQIQNSFTAEGAEGAEFSG